MASASVLNVFVGLIRMKLAALLLGPSGVGQIGLYQNILVVAASLASLGIGTTGTRQIAEAIGSGDRDQVANARRALFLTAVGCAAIGAGAMVALAGPIAVWFLDGIGRTHDVMLLALGVGLTVLAGYQTAILTGLHRVGDVARLSVISGIVSTGLATLAMLMLKQDVVIAFVLATPVVAALTGWAMLARVPAHRPAQYAGDLRWRWRELVALGVAFTIAGSALSLGQLAARLLIDHHLGSIALGKFQAAWYVSVTYLAFILQAMTTDFYPRLAASISRPGEARRIINEQTEVALALSGPVLIGLIAAAPWVMKILYTSDFASSALILQWQVLGDLLKIAAWPLGYMLLATKDGRGYLTAETIAALGFVAAVFVLIDRIGLEASGIAVVMMYMVYLPTVKALVARKIDFSWSPMARRLFGRLAIMLALTFASSRYHALVGLAVGAIMAMIAAYFSLKQFRDVLPVKVQRLIAP